MIEIGENLLLTIEAMLMTVIVVSFLYFTRKKGE